MTKSEKEQMEKLRQDNEVLTTRLDSLLNKYANVVEKYSLAVDKVIDCTSKKVGFQ